MSYPTLGEEYFKDVLSSHVKSGHNLGSALSINYLSYSSDLIEGEERRYRIVANQCREEIKKGINKVENGKKADKYDDGAQKFKKYFAAKSK